MSDIRVTSGQNARDFFFFPAVRFSSPGGRCFLTLEWLVWYVGVCWSAT